MILEGYFDESGIHDGAPVCIVAGYYAERSSWKKYESSWKKILRREGIKEFHAKVFFGPAPEGSEYLGWSSTRRRYFIEDLLETIIANKLHPVGSAVVMDDWKRLSLEQRKYLTGAEYSFKRKRFTSSGCPGKAYFLPFQDCLAKVARQCEVGQRAHFFFDLNKQFSGYTKDLYALIKTYSEPMPFYTNALGTLSLPTGFEAVHLQAADLYCYLLQQHIPAKLKDKNLKTPALLRKAVTHRRPLESSSLLDWEEFAARLARVRPPTAWSKL